MPIRIVTDSTCDLPEQIAAQYGIAIVPLYINFGLESYLDGIDLSREEFYARLPDCDLPPTTAVPGPQRFLQAYQKLAGEGATEILSIHISRSLSAAVDTARLAAREASTPVTVFDSGSLSLGTGFLVWAAAEAAAQGHAVDEILALIREQAQRTHVFAALDTLEFLRRSGRMSRVMATLGSWLQMKPDGRKDMYVQSLHAKTRRFAQRTSASGKGGFGAYACPRKSSGSAPEGPTPVARRRDPVRRDHAGLWHTSGPRGGRLCMCQRT